MIRVFGEVFNMAKLFIVFTILILSVYAKENDQQNVDVDELFSNRRLLMNYVNCLLDKGKCGPDAAKIKS